MPLAPGPGSWGISGAEISETLQNIGRTDPRAACSIRRAPRRKADSGFEEMGETPARWLAASMARLRIFVCELVASASTPPGNGARRIPHQAASSLRRMRASILFGWLDHQCLCWPGSRRSWENLRELSLFRELTSHDIKILVTDSCLHSSSTGLLAVLEPVLRGEVLPVPESCNVGVPRGARSSCHQDCAGEGAPVLAASQAPRRYFASACAAAPPDA